MLNTELVRESYNLWATVYDHDANPLPALEEPIVQAAAGKVTGLAALDLGCGTGRHATWLNSAGANVTAVDFSPGMLEVASCKPGADKIRFLELNLNEGLPFAEEFDLIVSGLVLEHLSELPKFFAEIKRVLKPNGHAIVSTMHPAMFLKGSKARFTDPESGELIEPGSINHSFSACIIAATHAGLKLADVTEHSPSDEFAAQFPRAKKYIGWPMLVVFSLSRSD